MAGVQDISTDVISLSLGWNGMECWECAFGSSLSINFIELVVFVSQNI